MLEGHGNKKPKDWMEVQSKKEKRRQHGKQLSKQPLKQPLSKPHQPQLKHKRKKPLKSSPRPNALIIRPNQKDNYTNILCQIKKDVPNDQVRSTVDKVCKITARDLLIILSKQNKDNDLGLQTTIADLLKEEATLISKGPQEDIEIRDLDNTTTKEDILAALQKMTGEDYQNSLDAIRSLRSAYRSTQTASMTLTEPVAQRMLGDHGEIRIDWINCRIRAVVVRNREDGFVAAWVNGIRFYSCYAPPSLFMEQFSEFLDRFTEDARQYFPLAIADDFNSWSVDWGSKFPNTRGKVLLEAMAT
ncbi:hypothetical protein EVAR_49551_1 [Eumeta japonica]|uniref:Endonuclease/exonuclease/phosphatase domain-containing protein n=1 Tax=Eumeta variegata TaxID=151549 RepID=A0A4C1XMJ3_EUMVA|nr:hypothetical protein EVAR_49551_1 [Eumeta japonica]